VTILVFCEFTTDILKTKQSLRAGT